MDYANRVYGQIDVGYFYYVGFDLLNITLRIL